MMRMYAVRRLSDEIDLGYVVAARLRIAVPGGSGESHSFGVIVRNALGRVEDHLADAAESTSERTSILHLILARSTAATCRRGSAYRTSLFTSVMFEEAAACL